VKEEKPFGGASPTKLTKGEPGPSSGGRAESARAREVQESGQSPRPSRSFGGSTEWCKSRRPNPPMALPARHPFSSRPPTGQAGGARRCFRLVEVTGILNGSNLKRTPPVWPGDGAGRSFCSSPANKRPGGNSSIQFISPHCDVSPEPAKASCGSTPGQSQPVRAPMRAGKNHGCGRPFAVGSQLDVEVIRRIKARQGKAPSGAYWKKDLHLAQFDGAI